MTRFSKTGYILSTAGSAIGLGGIWGFPYLVGQNGGFAFVLVFVLAFLVFGVSVFIVEMLFGRASGQNSVSTFENFAPKHLKFLKYGGFMVISGVLIFAFYVVVLGWLVHYMFLSVIGLPKTLETTQNLWGGFISNQIGWQMLWHFAIVALCAYVLNRGVKAGIEKLNLILMPLLLFIFLGLLAYSMVQDAFVESFKFLFHPNFEKINAEVIVRAIGQAFFSLSLGVGVILVYSNSMPKQGNFVRFALIIALLNFFFCLVAGLVIFTFIFGYGAEPTEGVGLVFISLPLIFANMGVVGQIIAFLFFVSLIFAGVTSAVSMLEPLNSYLIERFSMKRHKANLISVLSAYALGIIALLSNTTAFSADLTFFGKNLFDWFVYLTSSFMLPLAGVFMCLYMGWILPKEQVYAMLEGKLSGIFFKGWYFVIRFIAPLGILAAMANLI
ncbi:MAG: sodium-dependent transporter [Helicobacter sp.]|uniref:sodium-dependent transporter n=1 Tax=Helicobacter sp. TaxID=218 RepID=UPI0023D4D1BF|nr:sodium-dependent transporter [Helicobacter sp.]MDE5925624.1 sodium-dependent transporter [Helicobacter sp.]MDE7175126.1 sodium-dependent transporter [Helicobacter sp.]